MTKKKLTQSIILQTLDWSYSKAVNGVAGLATADELAKNYLTTAKTKTAAANNLIRWQNAKAGSSGFVTGIGGLMTLPLALPANLASVLFIQIRMIAAIARMGGYDLHDDKVKSLVYLCMAGNVAKDIVQELGITVGGRITAQLVGRISEQTILNINQKVGFLLLSKAGGRGTINLGKAVPLVGGVIGGSIDIFTTNLIGNVARNTFITSES